EISLSYMFILCSTLSDGTTPRHVPACQPPHGYTRPFRAESVPCALFGSKVLKRRLFTRRRRWAQAVPCEPFSRRFGHPSPPHEQEPRRRQDARERRDVAPAQRFAEHEHHEQPEHGQRDCFLGDLELPGGPAAGIADA